MKYAVDIIIEIITKNKNINSISVVYFPKVALLQDRFLLTLLHKNAVELALRNREALSLPFWDSLLLTQFHSNLFSKEIIQEANLHNEISNRSLVYRDNITMLQGLSNEESRNIGFNSLAWTSTGKKLHIPMLDFHIPNEDANIPCVKAVLEQLKCSGYLLKTNKSFHFYGSKPMLEDELLNFLSKALLFSPIIDKNWIAHQLIEKSATLRISSKEGRIPFLIEEITN